MTLLPLQVGNAVPFNQPALLASQVTSQPSSFCGTPTMDVLTFKVGMSNVKSVEAYCLLKGCSGRIVTCPCGKPVEGKDDATKLAWLPLPVPFPVLFPPEPAAFTTKLKIY